MLQGARTRLSQRNSPNDRRRKPGSLRRQIHLLAVIPFEKNDQSSRFLTSWTSRTS